MFCSKTNSAYRVIAKSLHNNLEMEMVPPDGREILRTEGSNQSDSYADKVDFWNSDPNPDAVPDITTDFADRIPSEGDPDANSTLR